MENLEFERALLYYLLTDKEKFVSVIEQYNTDLFTEKGYVSLFSFSRKFFEEYHDLPTEDVITSTNNPTLIATWVEVMQNPSVSYDVCFRLVTDTYKRRKISEVISSLSSVKDLDAALDSLLALASVKEPTTVLSLKDRRSLTSLVTSVMPTGFKSLDRVLAGGLKPGELIVVVAATAEGKSTFLVNLATTAMLNKKRALYITFELSRELILRKIDSILTNIPTIHLLRNTLTEEERERYHQYLESLKKIEGDIAVLELNQSDFPTCKAHIVTRIKSYNPNLILLDYINLLRWPRFNSVWMEQGEIAKELRLLASFYKVPIVTAAQSTRVGIREAEQVYGVEHVALSSFIPNTADVVLSLKREEDSFEEPVVILLCGVLKNRTGSRTLFKIAFDQPTSRMIEVV